VEIDPIDSDFSLTDDQWNIIWINISLLNVGEFVAKIRGVINLDHVGSRLNANTLYLFGSLLAILPNPRYDGDSTVCKRSEDSIQRWEPVDD
jgi:hypothetical protein